MKYLKNSCLIGLFIFVLVNGCVKNTASLEYTGDKKNSDIVLSKTEVKRGEPLLVSANAPASNSIIRWSVNPSANTTIIPANNQATIFISLAGTYRITASYYSVSDTTRAYDSSYSPVIVNDSVYAAPPPSGLDTVSLSGDEITLIPSYTADTGLVIRAVTGRLYNCFPYITAYGFGQSTSALEFDFNGAEVVEGSGNCQGVKNQATARLFPTPLAIGVYTITANLNQVNYQGSLNVTDSNYTFTWNYSSGVVISPLQIKKE